MSSVHSLTWLPDAIHQEVATDADRALAEWAQEWNLPAPQMVECATVAASATGGFRGIDLRGAPPVDWNQALARALFGFDAAASPLVAAVVLRVIGSLQARLSKAFGATAASGTEPAPLGDRGVFVKVDLFGQGCGFELSCAQLRACGRLKPVASQALSRVNLEKALAHVPVPLVAELGKANVNIQELLQLQLGDVLLLNQSLDTPLRVFAPGSSLELTANLGMVADPPQRAVRWLAS